MMIKDQIMNDLKTAMREKDNATRNTLRLMQAAIKQAEVDSGTMLDDTAVLAILQKQAKQRRESIVEYERAERTDLSAPEKAELSIINHYLPQMMNREEIMAIAQPIVADIGGDMKNMGKIMGKLMPHVKGKADGKLVNQIVKELLS